MDKAKKQVGVGTANISENAKKYVNDVLDSGRLSYGKYLQEFEKKFSEYHGAKYGVMMNSGTDALRLSIACLKEAHNWSQGAEIILPATTFISDYNVIVDQGLKPVFVDVESNSYNIDLKQIENSCETMFVSYKEKKVGSFGDISCFSTYMAHLLTSGVGGLALTNNKEYAVILRSLMNHGRDSIYISIDDDKGLSKEELQNVVLRRFSFVRPGYSARVTEMEGALALAQFEEHDKIIDGRFECAQYYISQLSEFENFIQLPHIQPNREHAYMMFPIVIKDEKIIKKDLVMFLEK